MDIFLAPCSRTSRKGTYQNFQKTVLDPVSPDRHPEIDQAGFSEPVSIWGVVSGNERFWQYANAGDLILFYTQQGRYTHAATIVGKAHDEEFGDRLWKTYNEGRVVNNLEEPWPYLLYLIDVREIAISSKELHATLDYDDEKVQNFRRVADHRLDNLRREYGSLESFVEEGTGGEFDDSVSDIETESERLMRESAKEPPSTDETSTTTVERKVRSAAFRQNVREIYNNTCCICGSQRETPTGSPEVEAAHILPKSEDGPDDLRNGLALCKLHHWAFDTGWIGISDDLEVIVKDAPARKGYDEFSELEGDQIKTPVNSKYRPYSDFLDAHRSLNGLDESP